MSGSAAYVLPKTARRLASIWPNWSELEPSWPKYIRSRSVVIGMIERLTETRGSPSWPAALHASRKTSICLRCWTWKGSPVSSALSVELIRCMPFSAVHLAVASEAAPHQMRSRRPGECGSGRSRPGGLGNIGRGLGWAKPSPSSTWRKTSVWRRAMSAWSSPSAGA